jgi:ATP-dependent DNA helicase PIF1
METLNEEQLKAFQAIQSGKSIFLTGPGGTGKSYLIKQLYEKIPYTSVTAMTGCAALLLGKFAKTLHSWSGIGLGRDPTYKTCAIIRRSRKSLMRWLDTKVLIIDEVSMMTSELLEKLDEVARIILKCDKPMGGLQIVFVGDFYQLPPVFKAEEGGVKFIFESPLWSQIVQETIDLKQIVRQSDPIFQTILNEARIGKLSEDSIATLRSRQNLPWNKLVIKPTLLFSRRSEVDIVNERNLKALSSERRTFDVETAYGADHTVNDVPKPEIQRALDNLDKNAPYKKQLVLAVGAQVMLLKNKHEVNGLMNGSRGVVTSFDPISGEPFVKFLSGIVISVGRETWESEEYNGLKRKQIPLNLAYAVTIHKSQGATLDLALIDIGRSTFECGQAYVALSRVKSLESLYIWNFEPSEIRANKKVVEFYSK